MTLTTLSAAVVWLAVAWRPRLTRFRAALRDLRSYSLHSVSGFLASFVSTRTDALLLGAFFGPVAIGLYRFVVRITEMVSELAVGGLGQVSLPHLSRFNSDTAVFGERLGRVIHAGALIAFPAFGVLVPAAPWLLRWVGPQWVAATPALLVLCAGGAIGSLGTIFGAALQAAGRPGTVAAIGWGMAGSTVLIMWLVGVRLSSANPQTQVVAMAVVFSAIQAVATVVCVPILFRRILRIRMIPAFRPALPAVSASVAAVLSGWGMQPLLVGASPFRGLVVSATVATICASAVLIVADAEVSSYCRRLFAGRPARRALAALRVRRHRG